MIHALELENFKAFGESVNTPFAPITLLFGDRLDRDLGACNVNFLFYLTSVVKRV